MFPYASLSNVLSVSRSKKTLVYVFKTAYRCSLTGFVISVSCISLELLVASIAFSQTSHLHSHILEDITVNIITRIGNQ